MKYRQLTDRPASLLLSRFVLRKRSCFKIQLAFFLILINWSLYSDYTWIRNNTWWHNVSLEFSVVSQMTAEAVSHLQCITNGCNQTWIWTNFDNATATFRWKGKNVQFPHTPRRHNTKRGGIAPLIPHLDTTLKVSGEHPSSAALSRCKSPRYSVNRKQGGPRSRSGSFREKYLLLPSGFEHQMLRPTSWSP